ncbi:hypothetical protein [Actinoplanes derwentensis]|uniref:Uncharacterized protein n=1 Tax=Actinoplanes derwentensis TaxID=113562 RepID=A0A1H1VJP7_9ACTN|nr:hypothetical protein [Actinoplanes derwentensis]GID83687.1 hypothetical protein Ade03nite_26110 [Actinoplanes derwentensis]SDS84526.1 hypothetical protein SAMN04489716_1770 [Actinoplanes derwentensis]
MKLLDVRDDLTTSHRTLRIGESTLTSTRRSDGTIVIEVGRQLGDGSWQWTVDGPGWDGR